MQSVVTFSCLLQVGAIYV